MSIMTLKPGLLVSLSTRLSGGVSYQRIDLDADKPGDTESAIEKETVTKKVERWETTKTVQDPEELKRASKVRSKCGSLIRSVCSASAFGLLCPESREKDLDDAIAEARALATAFNATARLSRVSVFALKGRIAANDAEAARAIKSELRDLLDGMRAGIEEVDVEKIRDAASRAKKMGGMLDEKTAGKVSAAIEEAREIAREITKKLTAKATDVADYAKQVKLASIEEARFAFIDTEEGAAVEALPSVDPRAVDYEEGDNNADMAASAVESRAIEC